MRETVAEAGWRRQDGHRAEDQWWQRVWAARRYGGMTLREAGDAAGGVDYTAVAMAVKRMEQRAQKDNSLWQLLQREKAQCETWIPLKKSAGVDSPGRL